MSQRLAVCVASRTKLAHTHTSIWLLLLSHWMVSVSCVCVCCFLSLCEWESMPILDEWLVTQLKWEREREREIKWWWLNHEWQHYTLSRALRARGRRATLPSWDRYRCVCLNTNDIERLTLIVLCYWLCSQLLHVDLVIINTNVVLPTQQQQQTHLQTPTSSTSNIHLLGSSATKKHLAASCFFAFPQLLSVPLAWRVLLSARFFVGL